MAYDERIIAYADILGWKEASTDSSKADQLENTIQKIAEYAKSFSEERKRALKNKIIASEYFSVEFSFFSDNFAVSALVYHGQVAFKIMAVASDMLLGERFLIRGGVTIGDLSHHQGIIFGPALNKAVEIEQKTAVYPRLLCSKELGQHLKQTNYRDEVVLLDVDEELVVNLSWGSPVREKDLMAIIEVKLSEEKKLHHKWKWLYMQEMLPKMYRARRP